jgi:hypothetical protein
VFGTAGGLGAGHGSVSGGGGGGDGSGQSNDQSTAREPPGSFLASFDGGRFIASLVVSNAAPLREWRELLHLLLPPPTADTAAGERLRYWLTQIVAPLVRTLIPALRRACRVMATANRDAATLQFDVRQHQDECGKRQAAVIRAAFSAVLPAIQTFDRATRLAVFADAFVEFVPGLWRAMAERGPTASIGRANMNPDLEAWLNSLVAQGGAALAAELHRAMNLHRANVQAAAAAAGGPTVGEQAALRQLARVVHMLASSLRPSVDGQAATQCADAVAYSTLHL